MTTMSRKSFLQIAASGLAGVAAATGAAGASAAWADEQVAYTPGTYTSQGYSTGFNVITTTVTFDESAITDVVYETLNIDFNDYLLHEEWVEATNDYAQRIAQAGTIEVDGIVGATLVTEALKTGVADCTYQATGGKVDLYGFAQGGPNATKEEVQDVSSWRTAPEPITDELISEFVDCDIVVVGGGVSGVPAAAKATELGAKTVLIDKVENPKPGANWIHSYNDKWYKEAGGELDRAAILTDLMWHANYHADQRLIAQFIDYSGEFMDWYGDLATSTGEIYMFVETHLKDTGGMHLSPLGAHVPIHDGYKPMGPNATGIGYPNAVVRNIAIEQGLDYRVNTAGVQLVTNEAGDVTGLIAQNMVDGSYIKFNVAKGVILCTGGYIADDNMCKDLNPYQEECGYRKSAPSAANTGDGIKMAYWIGADMADLCWWMDGDRGLGTDEANIRFNIGSQPFLRVNCFGQRFCNEDVPYDFGSYAGAMCPDHHWWMIMDANYYEQMTQFDTTICSRMVPAEGAANTTKVPVDKEAVYSSVFTPALATGQGVEAQTWEELIAGMQQIDGRLDADTFMATIERYNELCELGEDLDFAKLPLRLMPLTDGPFYAFWITGSTISNLDGLRVNEKIEVIRKDGSPIKGLYAAGNDQGGFYGISYPWYYGGLNCGRSMTLAYQAAKNAAAREV